jgi:hypothetical protein
MASIAELEISLRHRLGDTYSVDMRYRPRDSDAEETPLKNPLELQFYPAKLLELNDDATEYGKCLTGMLFPDDKQEVITAFNSVRANVAGEELRVRLYLDPNAIALHEFRWESLRDLANDAPLFTSENLWCSRYLSSSDWRPVKPRSKGELRALVAIASPTNIAAYGTLEPVDSAGELTRAKKALGKDIQVEALVDHRATLKNIFTRLREGFDILYLVCHGTLKEGSWLWLEADDESGKAARVSGSDFATRVRELAHRPCLAVLASCESAGRGGVEARTVDDHGVLASLGPSLAEAGVAAVVAMNGSVTMKTVEDFMPVFFTELQKDGRLDRAMAIARGMVREREDHWMPVLFSRLSSGCIWYEPGFRLKRGERAFDKWDALFSAIRNHECTPILGPGLLDPLVGRTRELAQRWAVSFKFPMAQSAREDLPEVAQFVSVARAPQFVRNQLREHIRSELLDRYRGRLSTEFLGPSKTLDDLFSEIARIRREDDTENVEPHKVLAKLDLPIYITTNPCCSLENALTAQGKHPRSEYCRWYDRLENKISIYDGETNDKPNKDYVPDPENPLVFHMFGRLSDPESLVITEDNYFDFLIGVSQKKKEKRDPTSVIPFPFVVGEALSNKSLMFLGFSLDEWVFRVLFRTIMAQGGSALLKDSLQVAAQVEPEEGRIANPVSAREYLKDYFKTSANIDIFWGSVDDFVRDFVREYEAQGGVI